MTYDARGIGESKSMGHRGDFLKRIEDFKMIIEWIKREEIFKDYKIYALGMSIGALTALCAGFPNINIEKIIAISSMSHYKQSISTSSLIVKFIYFLKGVDISPNDEKNQQLSPYIVLEKFKSTLTQEDWEKFSKRVLLIHSRNDNVIPFLNFEENKSLLELSEENVLVLRKGGHMQKKNELALVGAVTEFGYKKSSVGGKIKKHGFGLGIKSATASVGIDLRFINTNTGEIIAAENVQLRQHFGKLPFHSFLIFVL